MLITRIIGGVCYSTATRQQSLDLLKEVVQAEVVSYLTPRGWRVEYQREGRWFYIGLIMDPMFHAMRSVFVDPETGTYLWALR